MTTWARWRNARRDSGPRSCSVFRAHVYRPAIRLSERCVRLEAELEKRERKETRHLHLVK